jgi:thiosulfate/3-mercaptopyruvate sulfurtransferase
VNLNVDELATMTADDVAERLGVEPGAEIVVYCHSGSRSARAAMILQHLGYDGRNYVGSWHEWSRSDLPIE